MARKKKTTDKKGKEWKSFYEGGVRYMLCKQCQSVYCEVESNIVAVTCSSCTLKRCLALKPLDEFFSKKHKKTGRPAGWHWMAEFVDKDGTVYHKGKEQPELKGTLKPTKVKPQKKRKKLTKDEKLYKRINDWKKRTKARKKK